MMKKLSYTVLIAGLLLGGALVAFPQTVTQLAGLAVAQSTSKWNRLKDAAIGDAQTNGIGLVSPALFNGVTFDRQRGTIAGGADVAIKSVSGGVTPADTFTNPTDALKTFSLSAVFNGANSTWDRLRNASADGLAATGLLGAGQMLFNGSTQDRERTASADNLAATGIPAAGNAGFDGSTWDRTTSISNTNNTATTSQGVRYSTQLSTWSVIDTDVGATQATASRASGGGTVRHVATGVTICRGDTVAAVPALIHLRDGATGAGTILRSWVIGVSAVNESRCIDLTGLNMTGSAATAMTLEFAAAGSATSTSTVTLTGYSTP